MSAFEENPFAAPFSVSLLLIQFHLRLNVIQFDNETSGDWPILIIILTLMTYCFVSKMIAVSAKKFS